MEELNPERPVRTIAQRISIRWKVVQALGVLLIVLGLFFEWPSTQEANVPDTSSFLLILGTLLFAAGLLVAWRHE